MLLTKRSNAFKHFNALFSPYAGPWLYPCCAAFLRGKDIRPMGYMTDIVAPG